MWEDPLLLWGSMEALLVVSRGTKQQFASSQVTIGPCVDYLPSQSPTGPEATYLGVPTCLHNWRPGWEASARASRS